MNGNEKKLSLFKRKETRDIIFEEPIHQPTPEKKGCGAAVAPAAAIIGAVAVAVATKKKKED